MKYLDLFTGIGGFTKAIQDAADYNLSRQSKESTNSDLRENLPDSALRNGNGRRDSPACIGFSEIDKHASAIYKYHYPTHNELGDITKIDTAILPDFDLLVGGFPCQAFSIAGKRRGFADTRGTLFFEIARILLDKRPKYFLLENVKGLLSHDSGRTFSTIIETLQKIGYGVSWKVLNTKDFGIPQNRERVFIFGIRDQPPREILPIGNGDRKDTPKSELRDRRKLLQGGQREELQGKKEKADSYRVRRLTPLECERLQGFPDGWTALGNYPSKYYEACDFITKEVSDTQRYKCLGNAVTVRVVQAIIQDLFYN